MLERRDLSMGACRILVKVLNHVVKTELAFIIR